MEMEKSAFIFKNYTWDPQTGVAEFDYQINHNGEEIELRETLEFPKPFDTDIPKELLENVLQSLHLILGISYYKVFCPREIIIEKFALSKNQAGFWNTVYTKGLGEFFYKNQIDFRGLISFPYSDNVFPTSVSLPRQERSLLGMGGGKESIVAAELLKKIGREFDCFVLKKTNLQDEVMNLVGKRGINIKRILDPQIFELNKRKDVQNGHVPISAIYAFVGVFSAVLYDYKNVIVANERSSSYGNVRYLDQEINHQWSKSFEFECMLGEYLQKFVTPDVCYFSILRPFSEIKIAEIFSRYDKYFSSFSSCNRNFAINKTTDKKWCGECAKCAFVFSLLAAFLAKERLIEIFGENLFAKKELLETYKELLGESAIKPFDCVGTPAEVKIAFYKAHKKGEYEEDEAMRLFVSDVLTRMDSKKLLEESFETSGAHNLSHEFQQILTI